MKKPYSCTGDYVKLALSIIGSLLLTVLAFAILVGFMFFTIIVFGGPN